MTMTGEISRHKDIDPERLPAGGPTILIGQWYWVKNDEKGDRFSCVTKIGSNFVEFSTPYERGFRVHLDRFEKLCRREPDPESVIRGKTEEYKGVVREKLAKIRAITARLGVVDPQTQERRPQDEACRSLSVLSGTDNVNLYKKNLIRAKEKELPKLFEEIEEANKDLATWMKAQTLPLGGMINDMKGAVEKIEDRIFNVSLYAGLTEEVEEIAGGPAAPITEKLRIMQRLCYMDEECLVNYKHGGMEFSDIRQFDRWIARPENRDRILPFPRTMVAFQVRRAAKDRGAAHDLATAYIHFKLEKLDELTFLYIRNGEKLHRMDCDLDFGQFIFPGRDEFTLDEPMMAHMSASDVEAVITRRHYDDLLKETKEKVAELKRKHAEWVKQNPDKDDFFSPFRTWSEERDLQELMDGYEPFNKESVYYDEIREEIERRIKQYNRIALIVQGLYDRSEVLHPHPPVRLWSPEDLGTAVELIYADHGLYHGAPPDYEAYRRTLAASLGKGSFTIGQEDFFERREAERYRNRYHRGNYNPGDHYSPPGNPGPGFVAEVALWAPRARRATYHWTRKRQWSNYWDSKNYGDPIPDAIQVPDEHLFNVSAYKPGDFRRFYEDPRTRAQYLQWAPVLLAAEEFHAGNLDIATGRLKKKGRKKKED